jgi:hypothetical protein
MITAEVVGSSGSRCMITAKVAGVLRRCCMITAKVVGYPGGELLCDHCRDVGVRW